MRLGGGAARTTNSPSSASSSLMMVFAVVVLSLQCLLDCSTILAYGFVIDTTGSISSTSIMRPSRIHYSDRISSGASMVFMTSTNDNEEPDLFDYFDPLLSPHAYPDGISPKNQPNERPETYTRGSSTSSSRSDGISGTSFGFDLGLNGNDDNVDDDVSSSSSSSKSNIKTEATKSPNGEKEEEDLFDYFDPLLSPHAYPDGIKSSSSSSSSSAQPADTTDDDRYNPLRFKTLPVGSSSSESTTTPKTASNNEGMKKKRTTNTLGVLLIDHGSRSDASNVRLEKLAQLYQLSMEFHNDDDDKDGGGEGEGEDTSTSTKVLVQAAHMEIAKPSIEDGLRELINQNVGRF